MLPSPHHFLYNIVSPITNSTVLGGYNSAFLDIAPGVVSALVTQLTSFTSVVITWSPPQEPNGIITMYELIYRINESSPVTQNIADRFNITIESTTETKISEIMVRAYTLIGPGPFLRTDDIIIPGPCEFALLSFCEIHCSWKNQRHHDAWGGDTKPFNLQRDPRLLL